MAHAPTSAPQADAVVNDPRSRAYARARRHSRTVRVLKFAIPAGAAVAIATVLAIAVFDPFGRLGGLSVGPVRLSGTKLTMESPRLTGFRKDSRGYEVTATTATQDVRRPTVVELTDMRARLATDDGGGMAHVEADTGVFDTQNERLDLKQNVKVRTDAGQEVLLRSATVDFKAGVVRSREPVAVKFPGGTIDADSLDVQDHGKVMTFTGRVRTVFEGGEPKPSAKPPSGDPLPVPVADSAVRAPQPEPVSLRR